MAEYALSTKASTAPFEPVVVALTANTTKTVLQVAVPSTTDIRLLGWGVSFDGASATAVPVIAHIIDGDQAASVTSQTPEVWGHAQQPASLCVGGAALSGYNASGEGSALTSVRLFDPQHVHPMAGYGILWPDAPAQPRIAPSRFVRIRVRAQAAVNCLPWILWAEPAI